VISGDTESILEVQKQATEFDISKTSLLNVSGAFHSQFMSNVSRELFQLIKGIEFNHPKIPIISNLDARSTLSPLELKKKIILEITSPVLWSQTMDEILSMSPSTKLNFIECGCGSVLSNIAKRMTNGKENVQLIKC
jgi:[acyl-carrier-protein] S-malonyltransferase